MTTGQPLPLTAAAIAHDKWLSRFRTILVVILGGAVFGIGALAFYTSFEAIRAYAGRLWEAERAMSASGLRLAVESDAGKDQVVAAQQPPAGERLPLGSAGAVQVRPAHTSAAAALVAVP